jgi:hypothetical protein
MMGQGLKATTQGLHLPLGPSPLAHYDLGTMTTRGRLGGLVIGWLIVIGLLVATFVFYGGTRLSQPHRLTGFPQMPLYGAITWWFFLAIPMIGLTYGVLNEWRKK